MSIKNSALVGIFANSFKYGENNIFYLAIIIRLKLYTQMYNIILILYCIIYKIHKFSKFF